MSWHSNGKTGIFLSWTLTPYVNVCPFVLGAPKGSIKGAFFDVSGQFKLHID